jgi:probable phosphoglycerate mutase
LPPSPPVTLILIRHGETEWNRDLRFQGHGDSPLTRRGRIQARAIAERVRHMAVDTLVSSDLGRARETADLIARATGHTVQMDPRLRERHYGVLEGLGIKEILTQHPDVYRQLITEDPDFEIPQGETHRQHYQQNIRVLKEWSRKPPGTTAALVGHGGVLDNVFRYVANLGLNKPRCVLPANASLSIIQYGNFYGSTRWVIKSWADAAHLENLEPDPR